MIKYLFYVFHIGIITFFIGCGYKKAPVWIENSVNSVNIDNNISCNKNQTKEK